MSRITIWAASLLSLFYLVASAPRIVDRQGPIPGARNSAESISPPAVPPYAQPSLETGVALLHSFQYQQADQSFSEAAKRDPKWRRGVLGQSNDPL